MSSVGFVNNPGLGLASSLAGGQQARPAQNQQRADAAQQDFKGTLEKLAAKTSGDVDNTQMEADRDADGQYFSAFHQSDQPPEDQEKPENGASRSEHNATPRTQDLDSTRGRLLDFDA